MTSEYSEQLATQSETAATPSRFGRWALLIGTPLLLGGALSFHPHGGGDLHSTLTPVADLWLLLHVLLLPLFGLLGVSLYVLLDSYDGFVATIGRIGVATYLVFYIAFEAIAGIATGLLVRESQTLPPSQQDGVATALQAMTEPAIALALIGSAGALIAVFAIAVHLRRAGAPLIPIVFLAGVPITAVFHGGTHIDVFGMGLFLISVVWLEFYWNVNEQHLS